MFNSDKDDDFTAKDAKKKRDSFFTFLRNVNKEYLKSPEYKDQDGFADFVKENYFFVHTIRDLISEGISTSLLSMEKRKMLELSAGSDSPNALMLGQRRVNWIKMI